MSEGKTPLKKTPVQTGALQVQMRSDERSPDLADLRGRYLSFLTKQYEWVDVGQGIRQIRNIMRMRLEEFYIPLSLADINYLHSPHDLENVRNEQAPTVCSAFEFISRKPHLVILGNPGSGKTTLLKRVALSLAHGKGQEELGVEGSWLPIILSLAACADALDQAPNMPFSQCFGQYTQRYGLTGMEPLFEAALQEGRAFLLFDGIDEASRPEQRDRISSLIEGLVDLYPECRVVVTSRIFGYWDCPIHSFEHTTLLPLTNAEIQLLARQWYLAYETVGNRSSSPTVYSNLIHLAEHAAERFFGAIRGDHKVLTLARSPLLLTWMLVIYRQEGYQFPERRVELYRLYLEGLSELWNRSRSLSESVATLWQSRPINQRLVVNVLGPLALWMIEKRQQTLGRRDLVQQIAERMPAQDKQLAEDFLVIVQQTTGLLQERSVGQYAFLHLSLMEYLAARAITDLPLASSAWEIIETHLHELGWHEVICMSVAASTPREASSLINAILVRALGSYGSDAARLLKLVGDCLVDADRNLVSPAVWGSAIDALRKTLGDESIHVEVVASIATTLGYLGEDNRKLDELVCIPSGEYGVEIEKVDDSEGLIPTRLCGYDISRYLVTNSQYKLFVDSGGYLDNRFWHPPAWEYIRKWSLIHPRHWDEANQRPNHPVVGVTWFEAAAYCKWLTHRLLLLKQIIEHRIVRLPTENEWQVAACWDSYKKCELTWPWGNDFDITAANTSEAGIRGTTSVGIFTRGRSPFGAYDMAGNVWEWTCSTPNERYYEPHVEHQDTITTLTPRVVRGGAWTYDQDMAKCRYRNWLNPMAHGQNIGFRYVVCDAMQSDTVVTPVLWTE